jgi:hypothetical protein
VYHAPIDMTSFRLRSVATVTLTVGALTCSTSDPASVVDLADGLAEAFCRHQFHCCSPAEIGELAEGRYTSEAQCLGFARLSARQQLATLDSAIAIGHVTVDANAAAACTRGYENRACNTSPRSAVPIQPVPDVAEALVACPGLLVGHVPAGSRCDVPEECVSGTRCFAGSTGGPGFGGGVGTTPTSTTACRRTSAESRATSPSARRAPTGAIA